MIGAKLATLEELETTWSVDDLLRAAAIAQMRDDIEAETTKLFQKKTAGGGR